MSAIRIFFDLETGGLELHHPIIQLAAVAMRAGEQIGQFEAKLKFDPDKCDPKALEINGYTPEGWSNAQEPLIITKEFARWLDSYKCIEKTSKAGKPYKVAQLAGYNAAMFDAPRLQELFKTYEIFLPADYRILDVFQLVMWYFEINQEQGKPDSLKLSSVCEFFDIPLLNAHDALADVIATAQLSEKVGESLVKHIVNRFGDWKFTPANEECAQVASRIELERWKGK